MVYSDDTPQAPDLDLGESVKDLAAAAGNSPFDKAQLSQLESKLDPHMGSRMKTGGRKKNAKGQWEEEKASYLETNVVIDQANAIFGFGNWGYELLAEPTFEPDDPDLPLHSGTYYARVRVTVRGCEPTVDEGGQAMKIGFTDDGQPKKANGAQRRMARLGATSAALKRAMRHFGNQFGNSLYDKDSEIHALIEQAEREEQQGQQSAVPQQRQSAPHRDHARWRRDDRARAHPLPAERRERPTRRRGGEHRRHQGARAHRRAGRRLHARHVEALGATRHHALASRARCRQLWRADGGVVQGHARTVAGGDGMSDCRHTDQTNIHYRAEVNDAGWHCGCGADLGFRPDLDEQCIREKVVALTYALHFANLGYFSNSVHGGLVQAAVAARCQSEQRYEQSFIIRAILEHPDMDPGPDGYRRQAQEWCRDYWTRELAAPAGVS